MRVAHLICHPYNELRQSIQNFKTCDKMEMVITQKKIRVFSSCPLEEGPIHISFNLPNDILLTSNFHSKNIW